MAVDESETEHDDNSNYQRSEFYTHYDVKEVLGKGVSSVVRRCVEKSSRIDYAVKIIDCGAERSSEQQAKELREETVREISLLRLVAGHDSLIQLHDFYDTETFMFIVLELCRGGELFDYLTRLVTFSEKKTRTVMHQLLGAVSQLHVRNVVHRDLKPENILMVGDDKIKLTDFGFAFQLQPTEKLYELVGTPGYLAPEVLKSNMYDNPPGYSLEVDMWACGVIMYTLLCGYAPFYHRKQVYMLRMISEGRYEFRSPEWDEIGSHAKDLIKQLLVVEPEGRFTAKEALAHPFFHVMQAVAMEPEVVKFNALKRFRLAGLQIQSLVRLLRIRTVPVFIASTTAFKNPYGAKKLRRHIDACAFNIYGHWVKKANQERDMLFETTLKRMPTMISVQT